MHPNVFAHTNLGRTVRFRDISSPWTTYREEQRNAQANVLIDTLAPKQRRGSTQRRGARAMQRNPDAPDDAGKKDTLGCYLLILAGAFFWYALAVYAGAYYGTHLASHRSPSGRIEPLTPYRSLNSGEAISRASTPLTIGSGKEPIMPYVQVQTDPDRAFVWTRNGCPDITCIELALSGGEAWASFTSRRNRLLQSAGFRCRPAELDALCRAWLKMRGDSATP